MSDNGNTNNNPAQQRPQLTPQDLSDLSELWRNHFEPNRLLQPTFQGSLLSPFQGSLLSPFRSVTGGLGQFFIRPEAVENVLIPALNSDLLAARRPLLTENEMRALIDNDALASEVFVGGLRASIIAGKASVAELATLPPEAVSLLRYGEMREALDKGAITLAGLSKLNSDALMKAEDLVATGNFDRKTEAGENNFRELTRTLGLNQDQEGSLDFALDTFREKTSRENNAGHDHERAPDLPIDPTKPDVSPRR